MGKNLKKEESKKVAFAQLQHLAKKNQIVSFLENIAPTDNLDH